MFPDDLKKSVELLLSNKNGVPVQITETRSINGGSINEAYVLKTSTGKYFAKYNSAGAYPGMFEKEAAGLKILSETNTFVIPEVIGTGKTGSYAFLVLDFIESGTPDRNFWHDFGTKLADLHRSTAMYFGLENDNYIGSLVQTNTQNPDFCSFFISQRIEPQLKIARNKGAFSQSDMRYFDSLFNLLHNIIPVENPALVHGDLWSGNFMVTADRSPCLIDPSVYFGHRESDIALTKLFGGFEPEFYTAYNEAWPLEKDWQKRLDILNLYPLLVHENLFGGGYARQILHIIRQF